MKRAQEKGLFRYSIHNLTDWTVRATRRVDDRPYGGGPGTLITIEPLTHAIRELLSEYGPLHILLPSPRGTQIDQLYFEGITKKGDQDYLIICPHYEGVDERIFSLFDIETFSLGEYVISSGELASMVWIDGIVRLIPGVLTPKSLEEESFSGKLRGKKEYPQYSRPEIFEGLSVPKELVSGDPKLVQRWRDSNISEL